MATINILVCVDVQGATTPGMGGLANNVWMLDTGKYQGTAEAGNELSTALNAGDQVVWSLAAIDPGTNVAFATDQNPFSTQQTPPTVPNVINPKPNPIDSAQYLAQFTPPGGSAAGTTYQYSLVLSMDGADQSFDPFLKLAHAS
jgi:hypothetical protein